jgi:hypothetical protein
LVGWGVHKRPFFAERMTGKPLLFRFEDLADIFLKINK